MSTFLDAEFKRFELSHVWSDKLPSATLFSVGPKCYLNTSFSPLRKSKTTYEYEDDGRKYWWCRRRFTRTALTRTRSDSDKIMFLQGPNQSDYLSHVSDSEKKLDDTEMKLHQM